MGLHRRKRTVRYSQSDSVGEIAERSWYSSLSPHHLSIREAQEFVGQTARSSSWLKMSNSRLTPVVRHTNETYSQAEINGNFILLSVSSSTRPVLVHEMAHVALIRRFGERLPWHGVEFRCMMRSLVSEMLDPEILVGWEEAMLRHDLTWRSGRIERILL